MDPESRQITDPDPPVFPLDKQRNNSKFIFLPWFQIWTQSNFFYTDPDPKKLYGSGGSGSATLAGTYKLYFVLQHPSCQVLRAQIRIRLLIESGSGSVFFIKRSGSGSIVYNLTGPVATLPLGLGYNSYLCVAANKGRLGKQCCSLTRVCNMCDDKEPPFLRGIHIS